MPGDLTARTELTFATCTLYVRVPRDVGQQDAVAVAAARWALPNCGVGVAGERVDALLAKSSLRVWREEELRIRNPVIGEPLSRAIVCVDATYVQSSLSLQLILHMRSQARKTDATLQVLDLRG